MNLRRILQGLALCLFVAFFSNNLQAQSQLAGVNQDGLIQIGSNHPFVVSSYQFDLAPLGVTSVNDANTKLNMYIAEGLTFTYDFNAGTATMNVDVARWFDIQSVPVEVFNKKLKDIHRIRS